MIKFVVNGAQVEVQSTPMARLLDVLREDLRLTGSKEGCGEGECGVCVFGDHLGFTKPGHVKSCLFGVHCNIRKTENRLTRAQHHHEPDSHHILLAVL